MSFFVFCTLYTSHLYSTDRQVQLSLTITNMLSTWICSHPWQPCIVINSDDMQQTYNHRKSVKILLQRKAYHNIVKLPMIYERQALLC